MKIEKNSNCDKCNLFQGCYNPWMQSSGSDDPVILAVGEAPGEAEDEQGLPFVGRSGRLLRDALSDVIDIGKLGLDDITDMVRFTNIVRCRPPNNKITARAINYCKHYVEEEIEHYQPDLVLLFGNSPLKALLGEQGITTWNGVVVKRDDAIYVPLFHPAYILRNNLAMGTWLEGMDKAVEALVDEDEEEGNNYEHPLTIKEVKEMHDFLQTQEVIAYDTETTSLDPFDSKIVAVSFSGGDRTFSLPVRHSDHWTYKQLETVYFLLRSILHSHTSNIIGHNIKFDQQHTRSELGGSVEDDFEFEAGGDTMLLSHMLDSRRGIHSLKRLAGLHLEMYDYDKGLNDYIKANPEANPAREGNYGNVPLDILLPYAAMDADATYRLHQHMYKELSDKQVGFYHDVLIPVSNALSRVEYNGISIDDYIAWRYNIIYSERQEELYDVISNEPMVYRTVRILQAKADDDIIFDITDKFDVSVKNISINPDVINYTTAEGRNGKRKRKIIEFNPNSPVHLRTLFYGVYNMPVLEKTDTGLPTTKASVMTQLIGDYPIIDDVRYFKLLGKMLSTYIRPAATGEWYSSDKRVRSNYNLHGTVTGRLASVNPNLQNIPTPEKEPGTLLEILPVKNLFTTSYPNGVLMSSDYSGMELRVFASLSDCIAMLDIHRRGIDFHSVVALMVSEGLMLDNIDDEYVAWFKVNKKPVRYIYKWTNWTLLYGGDEYTLHKMYGIPLDEAKEAVDMYYDRFPEVLRYKDECVDFATTFGYIESPFGRRESLPYIQDLSDRNVGERRKAIRSAVNMPVQSAASDILLCALIVIDDLIYQFDYKTRIVNTVHDSIVLDVPSEEIDDIANICVDVMEGIIEYAGEYMPSVDFSWLTCPLKADIEVGTHYGTEIPYEIWMEDRK